MKRALGLGLLCVAWGVLGCGDASDPTGHALDPDHTTPPDQSSSSGGGEPVDPDPGSSSSGGSEPVDPGPGSSSSGGSEPTSPECAAGASHFRVRVVAGNLTGNSQSYDDQKGVRVFRGLQTDVGLIQEMRYGENGPDAVRAFVDAAFGPEFDWTRGPVSSNGTIPNGVASRWPMLGKGSIRDPEVGNRTFVWARIDLPGPRDLLVWSVHLLTTASARPAETTALMAAIAEVAQPSDYVVLGGDFNTDNRTAAGISQIKQRFVTAGPWPVDESGNGDTNAGRNKPYDWVVADSATHALSVPVTIGGKSFANGLVFDSRVFSNLSAVAPVQRNDSKDVQHMAVVRDFDFPCP